MMLSISSKAGGGGRGIVSSSRTHSHLFSDTKSGLLEFKRCADIQDENASSTAIAIVKGLADLNIVMENDHTVCIPCG